MSDHGRGASAPPHPGLGLEPTDLSHDLITLESVGVIRLHIDEDNPELTAINLSEREETFVTQWDGSSP